MTRAALAKALLVLALGACSTAALLGAGARWFVPVPLAGPVAEDSRTGRLRGWFTTRGFHDPEFDAATGRQFSWTSRQSDIRVSGLDRSRAYRISFTVLAGRGPAVEPPPELVISADNVPLERIQTTNERRTYTVTVPPAARSTLVLRLSLSNTFVPGTADPRQLGVVVDAVSIAPVEGAFMPTWRTVAFASAATTLVAAAALLVGLGTAAASAVALLISLAHVWLLLQDGAFLGLYVDRLFRISAVVAGLALVAAGVRRLRPQALAAAQACGLALIGSAVKFAFLWHPRTPVGDGIFHVHRAELVERGTYFFTSITPRPFYEFPYAIALYVNAMPFWRSLRTDAEHLLLLRSLALFADALVAVVLYFAVRRAFAHRLAALAAAALWPFVPISIQTLCTANLTNVYGQALFSIAMGLVLWTAGAGYVSWTALSATTALLSLAFLSHFSTLSVGVPLVLAVAAVLALFGRNGTRRLSGGLAAGLAIAAVVAYGVYYSHFHDTYRDTWARIASGEGAADTASMAAPVGLKASRWLRESAMNFGFPLMAAALVGIAALLRRDGRSPAVLVLAGWGGTWAVFAALAIFSPIEMRANLAAAPLAVILAAVGLGALADRSRAGGWVVAALAGAIVWFGFLEWTWCIR